MESAPLLQYLTEPTRYQILRSLQAGRKSVQELTSAVGATQSNISHQLRSLREHGFVVRRAQGRQRFYRLADQELHRLLDDVERLGARFSNVTYYTGRDVPNEPSFYGYG